MVTCVSFVFIHQMDIVIFSVGHLVRHSKIFCWTFINSVRLSDGSDEFRKHCHIPFKGVNSIEFLNENASLSQRIVYQVQ